MLCVSFDFIHSDILPAAAHTAHVSSFTDFHESRAGDTFQDPDQRAKAGQYVDVIALGSTHV